MITDKNTYSRPNVVINAVVVYITLLNGVYYVNTYIKSFIAIFTMLFGGFHNGAAPSVVQPQAIAWPAHPLAWTVLE